MSNLSQFLGGGGGGLTPKFQEFNSSGTFTPTQELIDAGGYIEVFLVGGGGGYTSSTSSGGAGGETILTQMYLSSTSNISVTIGAGGAENQFGNSSSFQGSSAGGVNVTAKFGGESGFYSSGHALALGAGFPGSNSFSGMGAGSGVLGYGAGGSNTFVGGVRVPKPNSGQGGGGGNGGQPGASGYCLIKWYE